MKWLFKPTKTKRLIFFLCIDILVFAFSLYLSFLLRFDFDVKYFKASGFFENFFYALPFFIFIKIFLFYINKLYFVSWQFISIEEFFRITISLLICLFLESISNYIYYFVCHKYFIPRTIPLIDFFISLVTVSVFRISKRFYNERMKNKKQNLLVKNAIIIGAGQTGERILREILNSHHVDYHPVGFLDDDPNKLNVYIHNVCVVGTLDDLDTILKSEKIDVIIIAIPTLSHKKIKFIYDTGKKYGVSHVKIVPSINRMPEHIISVKDLRDINLEDLLSREPVKIDLNVVSDFIDHRSILVTGGAGSIGSEIIRQLLRFHPKKVVAYEIDETELHNLRLEINRTRLTYGKKVELEYIVGDIKDIKKVKQVIRDNKIEVVFHAAAYKHVPLMEYFPEEAVKTNILGTFNLVKIAVDNNVEKFVNISTDKAVNPTSIMGATKRFAEMLCRAYNSIGITRFVSVRFGNVLGSRGSVIPIFLEQIKNGGPVTVTHPEMKRYFMTIPEAVLLVFQAAAMGEGGEVFVLDMGEPVKILHLAEELIKLNGLKPYEDIDIVFTGTRPGEKLFEELLTSEEGTYSTKHSKIFVAKTSNGVKITEIERYIFELQHLIESGKNELIKQKLQSIIPF